MRAQTSRFKLSLMAGACAGALFAGASGARADIIIQCQTAGGVSGSGGNLGCTQGQVNGAASNILFNDPAAVTGSPIAPVNTVKGLTNTTPKTLFDFHSTTDLLYVNNSGGGAATITAKDDAINNLMYYVDGTQPYGSTATGYTELDTNLDTQHAGGTVTFTIHALSATNSPETFTSVAFDLVNGSNKYAFIAQAGELIQDVIFNTTGLIAKVNLDVKQTQVTLNGNAIPIVEPSSLAMLGGSLVAMGIALRRRKKSDAGNAA